MRDGVEQARWRSALLKELEHAAREAPDRRVETIFFGGGTPSLMEPETVGAVIERVKTLWDTAPDIEITLEANPTSVEAGRFAALAEAGVNRVSLGVQALDAAALALPRPRAFRRRGDRRHRHGAPAFRALFLRPDLCPAGPDAGGLASRAGRRRSALAGEHLSLYQLTIERGTRFFTDHARGAFTLPGEDEAAAMFELTQARLAAAGLPAYEISNHARPGPPAAII